ncbi:MAG: DUF1489 family protein [Alphaproteobacteria bacterium]
MSQINIIKLVVGVSDLQEFYEWQQREIFDYHGTPAAPCWTRYKPKSADDILEKGGSIYRVIKNRIQCRHKILGFEMVETDHKGTMCMIVQDAQMIETVHMPRRAFQGWRYLKPGDIPEDKGIYADGGKDEVIPDDLAQELKDAGIL